MLTQQELKKHLHYNPATGTFTRIFIPLSSHAHVGDVAGKIDSHGHRQISINAKRHLAHRLAFLYMTGKWPNNHVDHINGNRDDNRWSNLRDVTRRVNNENRRTGTSATGFLGVSAHKDKFAARIRVRGKQMHLGIFKTGSEAHAAYVAAKRRLHDGNTL